MVYTVGTQYVYLYVLKTRPHPYCHPPSSSASPYTPTPSQPHPHPHTVTCRRWPCRAMPCRAGPCWAGLTLPNQVLHLAGSDCRHLLTRIMQYCHQIAPVPLDYGEWHFPVAAQNATMTLVLQKYGHLGPTVPQCFSWNFDNFMLALPCIFPASQGPSREATRRVLGRVSVLFSPPCCCQPSWGVAGWREECSVPMIPASPRVSVWLCSPSASYPTLLLTGMGSAPSNRLETFKSFLPSRG